MVSRTSGGLIKRSMTFEDRQLREIERRAAKRGVSGSALVRQLLDWGLRVDDCRQPATAPIDDLAIQLVSKEVA